MLTLSRLVGSIASMPIKPYHHGNLKPSLIDCATRIVASNGAGALSMRFLAEQLGVSRTALYHHFRNKDELLAAIATKGFMQLKALIEHSDPMPVPIKQHMERAVLGYLSFATQHAEQYKLMFSQTLWQTEQETPYQRYAKDGFRSFVSLFVAMQAQGELSTEEPPLRLAQQMWSSLHGLSTLLNDGILTAQGDLDVLANHLVKRFI